MPRPQQTAEPSGSDERFVVGCGASNHRVGALSQAAVGVSKQLPLLSAELMSCAKDTAHNNNLPRSTFKGVISCTACGFRRGEADLPVKNTRLNAQLADSLRGNVRG